MCPLFFSMDHHNFARYLTKYIIPLLNLNDAHPSAEEFITCKGFSVSRSPASEARTALDLTIEQTINRHAKCKGRMQMSTTSVSQVTKRLVLLLHF
ncbi:hypothetical protein PoB_000234300 [Plakobranchus ocellatus]|uniref:Uncharacterized protein n=1 Tax=Plakobranchus ocellatus TaxID=259542 RepID=A0AAV3Y048_9GAST|nr:hypothetical protein PoB_000234300 [Plakobranchus ocellatus]